MRNIKPKMSIVIGSVLATSLSTSSVTTFAANEEIDTAANPFTMQTLDKGYTLAYADRVDPNKYPGAAKSAEGTCGMSLADVNKDGKVTKEEFIKHHEAIFDKIDANKDGAVNQAEADGFAAANKTGAAPHSEMKK
jgi:hypothetical protein